MACASHMMNGAHIAESAHTGNLAIVTRPFSLAEGVGSEDETNGRSIIKYLNHVYYNISF